MDHLPETPLFIEHQRSRMYAVWYEPAEAAAAPPERGVVFCAPFAEEAAISQRVCVDFARVLARRGWHVLRFDYRGCGESDGEFDSVTLDSHMCDARAALDWFRRNACPRVSLGGLRLGASLAALVAAGDDEIESLLLWEPVAKLADHFRNFLRMQVVADNMAAGRIIATRRELHGRLASAGTIDVLGYPFTARCLRSFEQTDFLKQVEGVRVPTLILAVGRQKRSRGDLEAVVDACRRDSGEVKFDYVEEQPFWIDPNDPWRELASWQGHDGLFRQSGDWLDRVAAGSSAATRP